MKLDFLQITFFVLICLPVVVFGFYYFIKLIRSYNHYGNIIRRQEKLAKKKELENKEREKKYWEEHPPIKYN